MTSAPCSMSRRRALSGALIAAASLWTGRSPMAAPLVSTERKAIMTTKPAAVTADETFDGTWPFTARYTDAPGFAMHYVDEGKGVEPLLLLHGEPTWGYLFRNLIPSFSKTHRVIVPDHMGFGKSETPSNRTYWLTTSIIWRPSFWRSISEISRSSCMISEVQQAWALPSGIPIA